MRRPSRPVNGQLLGRAFDEVNPEIRLLARLCERCRQRLQSRKFLATISEDNSLERIQERMNRERTDQERTDQGRKEKLNERRRDSRTDGGNWEERSDGWWLPLPPEQIRAAAGSMLAGGARFVALVVSPDSQGVFGMSWHWI